MKDYYIDSKSFIIQFNRTPCDSESNILNSKPFLFVLRQFLRKVKKEQNPDFLWITKFTTNDLLVIYKALIVWEYKDLAQTLSLDTDESNRVTLHKFTEGLYDYWRSLERYGFFTRSKMDDEHSTNQRLIDNNDTFSNLVLRLYRTITQKILGQTYNFLRQLPAGTNANLSLVSNPWTSIEPYIKLPEQKFISNLLIRPPLMIYSKMNTRTGIFKPIDFNPLDELDINKNNYIVSALKIGPYLAYVYTHENFMKYSVSLGSLFESARLNEFKDKKPDIVYVFGVEDDKYDGVYHYDEKNDIISGFVSLNDKNDYFGYAKKMLLTLYNTKMLIKGNLPIHGAMFKLNFKDGSYKNVAIIGDSGAGKSETIESLRLVGKDIISNIEIVYDDMGTFYYNGNTVVSSGSEIGAFVRLDDLDQGYAYKQIDRAVFLNPNKVNARVVLPAASYDFIMKPHKVDMLLYANNYEDNDNGLKIFDNLEEIKTVFIEGKRKAKGTTSEVGMTTSYFANPFGPVQHQDITNPLIDNYFSSLFNSKIPLGVLYTKLAIDGFEQKGPNNAATKLLEFLIKK